LAAFARISAGAALEAIMRKGLTLVGACLLLAGPALAAIDIVDTTTTTTVVTPSAPPAPVVIHAPPVINSGSAGIANGSVGTLAPPRAVEIWREYFVGPDGQVHERVMTRQFTP
jgi:hypothetical protein